MPSWTVPSDSHSVLDTGHTTDHNHIADDLTQINNALPIVSGGLTGAVQTARFAGATTSGAPTAGTFAAGDFVVDRTGTMWLCVTAGSPGTWVALVSTSGAQTIDGTQTISTASDLQLLLESSTGAASINFTGPGNGSYFSGFNLGDGVYPLDGAGHYWGIQHDSTHDFLIFNYNGSAYTTVFQMGEDGAFTTVGGSTLDDGSGNSAVAGTSTVTGVSHLNGGTDTSSTAAASSPSFTSGTARQLSTTQDVTLYIAIQTSAALAVAIGPTSTPASTIMPSKSYALGLETIHVPKGWYVEITGTIADLTITQVTC